MLLLKDLKYMIKKNSGLFIILIFGLLFISILSMLLIENLQIEFLDTCFPVMNDGYLTFKYEEPQEASEIMDVINKHSSGIYSLYLVTEEAYLNNPYYYEVLSDYLPWEAPSTLRSTAPDEPGLVGYLETEYIIEDMHMVSGTYPDFTKTEIDATVITKSLESFIEDNTVSFNGNKLTLSGIISGYIFSNSLFFSERNILTSVSNYEKLGAETVIVLIHFYSYPTRSFLNALYSDLDALGENVNTVDKVVTFSISIVFEYIVSAIKYILILLLAFATLILTFNCWLNSQQSLYAVYYICGMKESKVVLMNFLQIILITTPIYAFAVIFYKIINVLKYKTVTYEMNPVFVIIAYVIIVSVGCIISLVKNKNVNGYNSLKNI